MVSIIHTTKLSQQFLTQTKTASKFLSHFSVPQTSSVGFLETAVFTNAKKIYVKTMQN